MNEQSATQVVGNVARATPTPIFIRIIVKFGAVINRFKQMKELNSTSLGKLIFLSLAIVTLSLVSGQVYAQGNDEPATDLQTSETIPEISITSGDPVTEGEDAVFTITTSSILSEYLTIDLDIAATSNQYLLGSRSEYNRVVLPAGKNSVQHIVETEDDLIEETVGKISLSLQASSNFTINPEKASASVQVFDNDPVVWITAGGEITEGSIAVFTVHSSAVVQSNKEIRITIDDGDSDFILGTAPQTATISAGANSGVISVPTDDDQTDEFDGVITAILNVDTNSPATYSINFYTGKVLASIIVRDNDEPTATASNLPVISIAASDTSIQEGTDARFTISAKDANTNQPINVLNILRVYVYVTDGSSKFLPYQVPIRDTHWAHIPAGSSSGTYSVSTIDDKISEDNGTIEAVILDGEGYQIGQANTASIAINDNDDNIPVISIESRNGGWVSRRQ